MGYCLPFFPFYRLMPPRKPAPTPVHTFLLLCSFLLAATATLAQSAPTGTIEGRVLNATNGQYLKNVRITVEGTSLETLTGEFGEYRLTGVPPGSATVHANYTTLPRATQAVAVPAGGTTERNFTLGATSTTKEGEPLKLDQFVVESTRETNAEAIATNEQRFASNIKSVMSSDAFGDVLEGNVGEFLKYMPGVTVDYVAADVRTISVGGFAPTFTAVSVDGGRAASAVSGNSGRVFELEQVSINNVARIEVTRVPTADQPMDVLGGSVNMISKSAFEASAPSFTYKLNLSVPSEEWREFYHQTPGPGAEKSFKVLPGFEFSYIKPVSKNFGYTVTALSSNQFAVQHRSQTTWNNNAAGTGATVANPFLSNYTLQDGPKNNFRDSVAVTADWRLKRNHVLSLTGSLNYYSSPFGNRNINIGTGTNATPTVTTGTSLSYSPTFTQGATGRGTITQGASFRDKLGATQSIGIKYNYNGPPWVIDGRISFSNSRSWYRDVTRGHFQSVTTTLQGTATGTVRFDNIAYPGIGGVVVKDAAGNPIDYLSLANYRIGNVVSTPSDGENSVKSADLNVRRNFRVANIPFSLKTGYQVRSNDRDNRRYTETRTFVGADGVANTADDVALPFLDAGYSQHDPFFGFPKIQWVDLTKLHSISQSNSNYFTTTAAQAVANETARINGSEKFGEVIAATFLQGETSLFRNRVRLVAGWRYEKTKTTGEGPLVDPDAPFQRTASGSFVDGDPNTTGVQRVRKPEAGAAGSLQELALVRRERLGHGSRSYDGIYPSINGTINLRENLQLRLAFAKTFGRPDFSEIIPNTTIDEADTPPAPGAVPGVITVRNPGLLPWNGENYDASLEYYFSRGGLASVHGYWKNISNFSNALTSVLTAEMAADFGLDPDYVGWEVRTRTNGGDSKISGVEFDFRQQLSFLGEWGRAFTVNANLTRLHLEGSRSADFSNFIPRTGNVGLTFNRRPFNIKLTFNYRGTARQSTQAAIQGFQVFDERKYLDLNFEYAFSKRATFFANGRNITNRPQDLLNVGINPGYSQLSRHEEFGVQWGLGIKGRF